MSRQASSELRRLEQVLARRPVSPEQRRRLQPVIGSLLARLARAGLPTAQRPAASRTI